MTLVREAFDTGELTAATFLATEGSMLPPFPWEHTSWPTFLQDRFTIRTVAEFLAFERDFICGYLNAAFSEEHTT